MSIVKVEGVTIAPRNTTIAVGSTRNTTTTVSPSNAANKAVSFVSSDPLIATVAVTGVITGIKAGKCQVTVTTEDGGFTDTVNVTVTE